MSIASELASKTGAPVAGEKKVWTPPESKVPPSAVTDTQSAPAPAVAPSTTMEGPKGHVATIIKQTDAAQKFLYLANCTCQFQGRAKTQVDIETTVQRHFERYE